jgi:uncharacterized protein (TIGR02271 family)
MDIPNTINRFYEGTPSMDKSRQKRKVAIGVFETRQEADQAVEELRRAGFTKDQIGVAARNPDATVKATGKKGAEAEHAAEGTLIGALAGAGIGGLVGLGVLAGVVPVIGPAIAAGTLGVILSNAAGGAAIVGLSGALIGWGMSEEDAAYYENEMKAGRYVVTVHAGDRIDEAWRIMNQRGAYNRENARAVGIKAANTASTATCSPQDQTLAVHEEQLRVQKQPVNKGEVKVRKEVVTEHQNIDVPVQREEVVIERRPVTGKASTSDIRQDEEIRIPVREEQVRVQKEAVQKEEVTVGKRKTQETEQVSGDVRKERIKVEREGDVDVRDSTDKNRSTRKK